ncbi:hypothetical protein, partial [Nocardia vaccinii]|uniref:hypothetical protein n=1 Tax=Nocardia vaccinii TaxID=1822 RepID=UPI001C3FB42D
MAGAQIATAAAGGGIVAAEVVRAAAVATIAMVRIFTPVSSSMIIGRARSQIGCNQLRTTQREHF